MSELRYQQLGFELLRLNDATAQAAWPRLPAGDRAWFIARAAGAPTVDPLNTARRFLQAIHGLPAEIAAAAVSHMDPAQFDHILSFAVLFKCYPPNLQTGASPAIEIARELAAEAAALTTQELSSCR